MAIERIYVVFKTHFDIGYTELAEEIIERYAKSMLPSVVQTCEGTMAYDATHRYVWTMAAWPLIQSINPQTADLKILERAKELIRNRQIVWHALPFTTHTEFCGLEEFIRGMYFSKKLSEEYGYRPLSAKMTDVPGHTRILPSLLSKAGVKFLHLGCNPASMPPDVPPLFFWEGPDGSRLLTSYSKGGYGTPLAPPEDWPFPVWLALMQTGDNIGPQSPEVIQDILDEARDKMPDAEVYMGTLDDFYLALSKCDLDQVPVIRGDLADTWIHGVGSYPKEVASIRSLRNRTTETEKALGMCMALDIYRNNHYKEYKSALDSAFENSILFGEHTWGLDVKKLGNGRKYEKDEFIRSKALPINQRLERSWDEQRERVKKAESFINPVAAAIMDDLAASVDLDGPRLVVFNGLGWKRDVLVNLKYWSKELKEKILQDPDSKNSCEIVMIHGQEHAVIKEMPAFGFKTLSVKDQKTYAPPVKGLICDAEKGILENRWFKIGVNKENGTVKSLVDKATGHDWAAGSKNEGFGQYRYDIYGNEDMTEFLRSYAYRFYDWYIYDFGRMGYPEQKHLTFALKGFEISSESGLKHASLIMAADNQGPSFSDYGNCRKLVSRMTIYEDCPFIDFEFELCDKQETPYIEAGHFVFPFSLENAQVSINKTGSVVDPSKDIVKDANHGLYCCENWVDISDGQIGMAVLPFDAPLFSIGEPAIYKFKGEYEESEPVLYFNAFNNSWGTNFPQWMGGSYSFSYRLIPHRGDWRDGNIAKLAFESVIPPLTGYAEKTDLNGSRLPLHCEPIQAGDGLEIIALKPAEDGNGLILRLREIQGTSRDVTVSFGIKVQRIYKCSLIEDDLEEAAEDTNRWTFVTKPFEIHTFRICF